MRKEEGEEGMPQRWGRRDMGPAGLLAKRRLVQRPNGTSVEHPALPPFLEGFWFNLYPCRRTQCRTSWAAAVSLQEWLTRGWSWCNARSPRQWHSSVRQSYVGYSWSLALLSRRRRQDFRKEGRTSETNWAQNSWHQPPGSQLQPLPFSPVLHRCKAYPPGSMSSPHTHREIKQSKTDPAVKSHAEEEQVPLQLNWLCKAHTCFFL